MKKFKAFLLSLFLVCGFVVVTVSASQASNVGFTMSTDKGSYSEKDKIKETFDIKNNAEETLNDLTLLVSVPSGYIVENGGNPLKLGNLEPGKQGQKTVTFVRASLPKQVIQKIKTGVATNTGLYIGLAVASVVVIILLIVLKGKNKNKMMTILLALSLGSGLISINTEEVQAKDIKETIETSTTVVIDGKRTILSASLTYSIIVEDQDDLGNQDESGLNDFTQKSLKEKIQEITKVEIIEETYDEIRLEVTIPNFSEMDIQEMDEESFLNRVSNILNQRECPIITMEKTVNKNEYPEVFEGDFDGIIHDTLLENLAILIEKIYEEEA